MLKNEIMQATPPRRTLKLRDLTMVAALSLVWSVPALATGSNVSGPAGVPSIPSSVVTRTPDLFVASGGCAQQYDTAISIAENAALVSDDIGLAANGVGAAADVTGLIAQEIAGGVDTGAWATLAAALLADIPAVGTATPGAAPAGVLGGSSLVKTIALGAQIIGAGSTVVGVAAQVSAQISSHAAQGLSDHANGLFQCDETFTGTVTVNSGGVNVTGDSYFNGDIGVDGNVDVSETVTANQVHAAQGISAHSGAIWLGDPNGTSYSSGITLGGGALSGAGTGGLQAFTGDVTAIAIGNDANAADVGSLALGEAADAAERGAVALGHNAVADARDAVAVGHNAFASGRQSVAFGSESTAGRQETVAIGSRASALGAMSVAIGSDAMTTNGAHRSIAIGDNASVRGDDSIAMGTDATTLRANNSLALGAGAITRLNNNQVFGTVNETYTMPGLTSSLSRDRQLTRLQLPTTDEFGNLASDGGSVFRAIARNQAGLAVAYALSPPQLTQNEDFGVRVGYGYNDGEGTGVGFNAIGVLRRGVLMDNDRLAFTAGIGVGNSEFYDYRVNTIAGGAGLQLTW